MVARLVALGIVLEIAVYCDTAFVCPCIPFSVMLMQLLFGELLNVLDPLVLCEMVHNLLESMLLLNV